MVIDRSVEAGLSKVHGPQSVVMDLHSFGQGLRISAVTLTRHMAAFRAVKEEKAMSRRQHLHYEIIFSLTYQGDEDTLLLLHRNL